MGLPGFLSGKLDIDGVDVRRREWWSTVRGKEELGWWDGGMVGVQGREGGDPGGQHHDEALGPVVGWEIGRAHV